MLSDSIVAPVGVLYTSEASTRPGGLKPQGITNCGDTCFIHDRSTNEFMTRHHLLMVSGRKFRNTKGCKWASKAYILRKRQLCHYLCGPDTFRAPYPKLLIIYIAQTSHNCLGYISSRTVIADTISSPVLYISTMF